MESVPGDSGRASPDEGRREKSPRNHPFELVPPSEVFPEEESILWTPWRLWLSGDLVYTPYEVVFDQAALSTVREHMASDLDSEAVGLMLGELHSCPESLRRWIKVSTAIGPVRPGKSGGQQDRLEAAVGELLKEAAGQGTRPVGWYHAENRTGFELTDAEAEIHAKHFKEPWQFTLVLLADLARPAGGLFMKTESGRLPQAKYRPFYELPSEKSVLPDGRVRTFVGWQNYQTERLVVRAYSGTDLALREAAEAAAEDKARRQGGGFLRRHWKAGTGIAAAIALLATGWFYRDQLPIPSLDVGTLVAAFGESDETDGTGEGELASVDFAAPEEAGDEQSAPTDVGTAGEQAATWAAVLGRFSAARSDYEALRGSEDAAGVANCRQLAEAYMAVDQAFLQLSVEYAALRAETAETRPSGDESAPRNAATTPVGQPAAADGAAADPAGEAQAPKAAYEAAASSMQAIDLHFDASDCPRPE